MAVPPQPVSGVCLAPKRLDAATKHCAITKAVLAHDADHSMAAEVGFFKSPRQRHSPRPPRCT
jgi:hypothetical protein